ncbi:MAG: Asp-tRNA(Asn)/Glu-tRNA(Gln) amidotransferase subunit GatA [Endomicrobiia bacterium]
MKLYSLSAKELQRLIQKKEIKKEEIIESFLNRITEVDKDLNAFVTIFDKETILELSKNSLENLELNCLPIAIKDNICIRGTRITCGSKILENYIAPYDATVIEILKKTGVLFLGKTNMDEFAMGSSTETSYFGKVKNPYDLTKIPGGSSGGSAVAVASGETVFALGSDTGGSIRQPAALCGVVGIKPTYGRVSRYGLVAFASSLDQIGVFARNVYDASIVLENICGYDKKDSTSVNIEPEKFSQYIETIDERFIRNIKIGLPKEYFIDGIQEEVKEKVLTTVKHLETLGAKIEEISLPHTEYAVATYYLIAPSEASSNLARYDGVKYGYKISSEKLKIEKLKMNDQKEENSALIDMYRYTRSEGFGAEVKRRIMIGTYALSKGYYEAYYGKAQRVRNLITQDFLTAFEKVDLIITPTTPTTAFNLGEKVDDPLQMYLSDIFTIPCNLAGLPGMSMLCGYDKSKLPIGLQILAPHFKEKEMLKLAFCIEQELKLKKPVENKYVV